MGLINTALGLNASFSRVSSARSVALVAGGALGLTIRELAADRGIGFSSFERGQQGRRLERVPAIWESDADTSVILLYLESWDPRKFGELARRIDRRKPIVAVRPAARAPACERRAATPPPLPPPTSSSMRCSNRPA
jgi:acyl-CoA synthetase (NDP forming)